MKNNENRKHVAEISAPVAEKPATLPNSATAETSAKAVNPIAAELPTARSVEGDLFGSIGAGLALEAARRYG